MTEFRARIEEEIPPLRRLCTCVDAQRVTLRRPCSGYPRPGAREGAPLAAGDQYAGVAFYHHA